MVPFHSREDCKVYGDIQATKKKPCVTYGFSDYYYPRENCKKCDPL